MSEIRLIKINNKKKLFSLIFIIVTFLQGDTLKITCHYKSDRKVVTYVSVCSLPSSSYAMFCKESFYVSHWSQLEESIQIIWLCCLASNKIYVGNHPTDIFMYMYNAIIKQKSPLKSDSKHVNLVVAAGLTTSASF